MLVFCTNGLPVCRAGGVSRHAGPVLWGGPGGAKNHKKRETVAIFSVSAPIRATPIAFSRLPAPIAHPDPPIRATPIAFSRPPAPRLPKMASSSPR